MSKHPKKERHPKKTLMCAVMGLNLTRTQQRVLQAISLFWPVPWPGYNTLMHRAKVTKKTLVKALKELESLGWIRRKHRSYLSNEYWVDADRILRESVTFRPSEETKLQRSLRAVVKDAQGACKEPDGVGVKLPLPPVLASFFSSPMAGRKCLPSGPCFRH